MTVVRVEVFGQQMRTSGWYPASSSLNSQPKPGLSIARALRVLEMEVVIACSVLAQSCAVDKDIVEVT